jgi:hypothetical protein
MVLFQVGATDFSFLDGVPRPALGSTELHMQCVPEASALEVRRPDREIHQSPQSTSDVKTR